MKRKDIVVTAKGVKRLRGGHPWVYRSDLAPHEGLEAGLARLVEGNGRPLGTALFSPHSEIRARWLAPEGTLVDGRWWLAAIRGAFERRAGIEDTGYRVVHAEGDGLPSLVVDRYGDVAVAQILSAGLETVRGEIVDAIREVLGSRALLLRNDAPVRSRERLPREVEPAFGDVPDEALYTEGPLTLAAWPRTGQKTGAYLDQRENHQLVARHARGDCLDVFTYHGGFALPLARAGAQVTAIDSSKDALGVLATSARRNGIAGVRTEEADAFDWLRDAVKQKARYDVIVLDPPAFAKDKASVPRALAGYKELNLQAMKLLTAGGHLFTASCSYHVHRGDFFAMLAEAAADSGRLMQLVEIRGAAVDHPEVITIPETGYLKGALLQGR